jgi:hypothetical protein
MPESEVDEILESIDEKDLEEDDCFFVFTLVLVERSKVKAQQKNKKRTWQQSRDLKKAMARDRSFFDRRRNQAPNKKPVRAGKKRLSIDQLKKASRCGNCWSEGPLAQGVPQSIQAQSQVKARFLRQRLRTREQSLCLCIKDH